MPLPDERPSLVQQLTDNFSQTVKNEVELLLNETLYPLKNYWVYIIALSFFVSAQLVTPVLGIGSFVVAELFIYLLLQLKLVRIQAHDAQIERYVLE
jgi:hypothetical protein